jgi:hypothetical protein
MLVLRRVEQKGEVSSREYLCVTLVALTESRNPRELIALAACSTTQTTSLSRQKIIQ